MVFGDNVRARIAARALPRTPQQKRKRKRKRKKERQATRTTHLSHHRHSTTHNTIRQRQNKTCTVVTTRWYADNIIHPPSVTPHTRPSIQHKPSHLFPNNTTLSQDTTLNQQCCDREHKDRRGKRDTVHPPHFPTHNKRGNTRQKRNGNDTKGTNNVKGGGPNPNTGTTHTHRPRHSIGPQGKRQGGRQHTDGAR